MTVPSLLRHLLAGSLLTLLLVRPVAAVPAALAQPAGSANLLVYHQLTDRFGGPEEVGHPVLSADGRWAVFAESPLSSPPESPIRVFVVGMDGEPPTQVDTYTPLGGGMTQVDVSADGGTIASSEGRQLRVVRAAAPGQGRELLRLAGSEIRSMRLSGDGRTIFFLAQRDTTLADGTPLPRGLWAVAVEGGPPRHLAGVAQVAEALRIPVAKLGGPGGYFYLRGGADTLAVSRDGSRVAFAAYGAAFGGSGEYVFTVAGEGGEPQVLAGPVETVGPVAISGDGRTVAYARHTGDQDDYVYDLVVVAGGTTRQVGVAGGYYLPGGEWLQLSADGRHLLVGSNQRGELIDVTTGRPRPLALEAPGARLLTAGLAWATMSANATRFLYVVRGQAREQLALLELGPASVGAAPTITAARLEPLEIPVKGTSGATATARVGVTGKLAGVWLVAMDIEGEPDPSIGGGTLALQPDLDRGPDIFSTDQIRHRPAATGGDLLGPRALRIQAEIEAPDGRRHATAFDGLTVTVIEGECTWSGAWSTSYGELRLTQTDSRVSGEYDWDQGRIQGTVSGRVLSATWSEAPTRQPPRDKGDVEFTMKEDCSITGKWRYAGETEWRLDWCPVAAPCPRT